MHADEKLIRQEAKRRGWSIILTAQRITVANVSYRDKNGNIGKCQVCVERGDDGMTMRSPDAPNTAAHAARLRRVIGGQAYQTNGEPVGNVLWSEGDECVISIKKDRGEYANVWEALRVYLSCVAQEAQSNSCEKHEDGAGLDIFDFPVWAEGADSARTWREKVRGCRIGIVGLGGVGAWILDLMAKIEVEEIRVWDGDNLEGRNFLRAPGALWKDRRASCLRRSQS